MRYALLLVLYLTAPAAHADKWPPAKIAGLASPEGQIIVRILPGSNADAAFSRGKNGKTATAIFYRLDSTANYAIVKKVSLLNPIAPVFAAVADTGELVTLDNWHNIGVGASVAVIYSPLGKVLRSYRLADIYTEVEIKKFDRSESSILWRCSTQPIFEPSSGAIEFTDAFGADVAISVKTGAITRTPTSQKKC